MMKQLGVAVFLSVLASTAYTQNAQDEKAGRPLHYGPFDVIYNFRGTVTYDDNIFIRPDKEDDVVGTLTPGIMVGAGDYGVREENLLTLEYNPSFIFFADHSDNNSIDHEALLNGQWRPGRLTLGVKQAYQNFSGAVIDVGDRVDRRIYTTDLLARYDLTDKTDVELEGRQIIGDYDRLLDYNDWLARLWLDYKITPLLKLGAGVSAGWVDVTRSVNQTYQQALVRVSYEVTELVEVHASAGGEIRQFQGPQDSRLDGVFSLGALYTPHEGTTFSLDGYRKPNTSVILLNNNYISTGISAGIRQEILANYALYFQGGYENADYVKTHPTADDSREDNYAFARVGAEWRPWERLTVGVFYQYRQNNSTERFDFDNNQVGMNVSLRF